jgi:hypothetical protein
MAATTSRVRRPGKIARLPEEARALLGALLKSGFTLDQILAKLRELELPPEALPGRTALGRWAKQQGAMIEEMQRQAQIGEALVSRYGEASDNRTTRLNIAMAQGLLTRLMFTEEGEMATLDAKECMFLADAINKLVNAAKADTEREIKIAERAEKKAKIAAANAVEKEGRANGLSAELIAKLKAGIFGKEAV